MDILKQSKVELLKRGSKYIFSVLDQSGSKSLLTSKSYNSKTSRDKGLQQLIKNLDRIENRQKDEKIYFVVKGEGNRQIAKSVEFDSEKEMDAAIDYIRTTFGSLKEKTGSDPMKISPSLAGKTSAKNSEDPDLPPKFSFRLEFYPPAEPTEALRGKIEYPFLKEKKTFEGIDVTLIENFLQKYLPEKKTEVASGPVSRAADPSEAVEAETQKTASSTSPMQKNQNDPALIPDSALIDYDLIAPNSGPQKDPIYSRSESLAVQLNAGKWRFSREAYTQMVVKVYSTSLAWRSKSELGQLKLKTGELKTVEVPLSLENLQRSGAYKIDVLVQLVSEGKAVPPFHLFGSRTVQIY